MLLPKKQIFVCVIDDKPEQVAGIKLILDVWPNLSLAMIGPKQLTVTAGIAMVDEECADSTITSRLADSFDLWLVDEGLGDGQKCGRLVVEMLRRQAPFATFASIEGGENMGGWAEHHFGCKSMITQNHNLALSFVEFMNKLLAEVESMNELRAKAYT